MSRARFLSSLAILLAAAVQAAVAVTVEPRLLPSPPPLTSPPPPARLAEAVALPPFAVLEPATTGARDALSSMRHWNLGGNPGSRPLQNGFSRPLPEPLPVRLAPPAAAAGAHPARQEGAAATASGPDGLRWAARVRVEGSYRLRLHLARVQLPPGAQLWVYGGGSGAGGPAVAFGPELAGPDGDLWTPSVAGPEITLELRLPGGPAAAAFDLDQVIEIVHPSSLAAGGAAPVFPAADSSCVIDGRCVGAGTLGGIADYRHAIAEFFFVKGGGNFICTGGLLNDTLGSGTPYLLTANHCISTQTVASTLEAFFDDYTSSCGAAAPSLGSLPRSNGATLLATSLTSDFAFLQLASLPANRFFLGWTTAALPNGTELYRLSNPCPDCPSGQPLAQSFSDAVRATSPAHICGPDPDGRDWSNLTDFIYSVPDQGATFGGSSGSPVLDAGGHVVGQLLGGCGFPTSLAEPCLDPSGYNVVDGAFAVSFASLSQWLSPASGGGSCVADAATLCLDDQPGDHRFKVQVPFHTSQSGGVSGQGHPVALGSLGIDQGGVFWFFNLGNPELLIKVLNACALGNHYWVFLSAGTNVGLTITVTDTVTGHTWTRTNPDLTAVPTIQDTNALPCT
jgi:Trypsin-like peptidase domain